MIVDLHSHLIPGVDDGARTVEEAMEAGLKLAAAGVVAAVTTPHFRGSLTLQPEVAAERLADLDEGWRRLMAERQDGMPRLHRGVELLLDVPDPDPSDPRIRLNGGPFVLTEFPHMTVPPHAPRVLRKLREAGAIPILAHPERYEGFDEALGAARSWKEAGAYLQVNGPSLVGRYGETVRRRAFALLENGLVDYLGSDYHCRAEPLVREYANIFSEHACHEALQLLTEENPGRLIEGAPPLPVPPARLRPSFLRRLLRR